LKSSFERLSYSKFVLFLIASIFLCTFFTLKIWTTKKIIVEDSLCYYGYLPAATIYHDVTLSFLDSNENTPLKRIWATPFKGKGRIIKMSMGLSFLYSPFFFIAHYIAAPCFGYPQDGFCHPYQMLLCFSCLFYVFIGLFFLRKILLNYFSEIATSLALLVIFFGTNLEHYTFIEPLMSHGYNFFLFAAFIYYILKFIDKPDWINSIIIGISFGLIILIRPSNAIIVIFPFLIGVFSFKDILKRFTYFFSNFKYTITIIVCIILVWVPQIIYWYCITSHIFFYSYIDERFFFNHPHIIEGLFGYRKGLFIYTPIIALSFFGFILLKKKSSDLFMPIMLFTIINIYVVFSWWCWWYGGSFGLRAMIDSYCIFAIPLAALFDYSLKKIFLFIPILILLAFFIFLNLFQSWQSQICLIHWDSMSKDAYWEAFLKTKFPDDYNLLLSEPDYENARKYGVEKEQN
jgi:hypothetical protein